MTDSRTQEVTYNRYRLWPSCSTTTKYGLASVCSLIAGSVLTYLSAEMKGGPFVTAFGLLTLFGALFCCTKVCESSSERKESGVVLTV